MEIKKEISDLRKLNRYTYRLLKDNEGSLMTPKGKEIYLLGILVSSMAQVDGIVTLAERKQYSACEGLARIVYEAWVNMRFIYCTRPLVFARVLVLLDERDRLTVLQRLEKSGNVTSETVKKHKKRVRSIERFVSRIYRVWPDRMPGVLTNKTSPATIKRLTLKQRCQIVDFYNSKYHRTKKATVSMVDHYELIYTYLSSYAHLSSVSMSRPFSVSGDDMNVDMDGSGNPDGMKRLCASVFALQFEIVMRVRHSVFKETGFSGLDPHIHTIAKEKGLILR